MLARRVREQRQHRRGRKVLYSLPRPEVECISRASAPPLRVAGSRSRSRHDAAPLEGGQFIAHAKALPGNRSGHTLAGVIPDMESQLGANLTRIVADRGYRGHSPARPQVQGLYLRPETPGHRNDQTRVAPPLGGQTGHPDTHQNRPPHGPQPSRWNPRRRRQRRPRRRRIRLQTPPRMAEALVVPDPPRPRNRTRPIRSLPPPALERVLHGGLAHGTPSMGRSGASAGSSSAR